MADNSNAIDRNNSWLRWASRGILLMSLVLFTVLFILIYIDTVQWGDTYYWSQLFIWDSIFFVLPALVITIIVAWLYPFGGGISAIIISLILFLGPASLLSFLMPFSDHLVYLPSSILLLIGGIMSIILGRSKLSHGKTLKISKTALVRVGWVRWLSRGFILTALLIPYFYNILYYVIVKGLGPRYWDLGQTTAQYGAPIIAIALILIWFLPTVGSIFILIAIPIIRLLWLFPFWDIHVSPHEEGIMAFWITFFCLLLLTGGLISIAWGEIKRRVKYGKV